MADPDAAARYFERAGTAHAMYLAASLHREAGRLDAAALWMRRAATAGHEPAVQAMRAIAQQKHEL